MGQHNESAVVTDHLRSPEFTVTPGLYRPERLLRLTPMLQIAADPDIKAYAVSVVVGSIAVVCIPLKQDLGVTDAGDVGNNHRKPLCFSILSGLRAVKEIFSLTCMREFSHRPNRAKFLRVIRILKWISFSRRMPLHQNRKKQQSPPQSISIRNSWHPRLHFPHLRERFPVFLRLSQWVRFRLVLFQWFLFQLA